MKREQEPLYQAQLEVAFRVIFPNVAMNSFLKSLEELGYTQDDECIVFYTKYVERIKENHRAFKLFTQLAIRRYKDKGFAEIDNEFFKYSSSPKFGKKAKGKGSWDILHVSGTRIGLDRSPEKYADNMCQYPIVISWIEKDKEEEEKLVKQEENKSVPPVLPTVVNISQKSESVLQTINSEAPKEYPKLR